MQEHAIKSPVHAIHDEWHVCKSTAPKTQVRQFPSRSSKGLIKPKVHAWSVLLIHNSTSPVHAIHDKWHACKRKEHALHIRLIKPKLCTWWSSQVHKIQGPPLVSLDAALQAFQNAGEDMSPFQGSINPRFTLGEPFLLLSSISTRIQGTQGLPLTIFSIPNFICAGIQVYQKPKVHPWYQKNPRSTLGMHAYKTQGTPLVYSLITTTTTTFKGPSWTT